MKQVQEDSIWISLGYTVKSRKPWTNKRPSRGKKARGHPTRPTTHWSLHTTRNLNEEKTQHFYRDRDPSKWWKWLRSTSRRQLRASVCLQEQQDTDSWTDSCDFKTPRSCQVASVVRRLPFCPSQFSAPESECTQPLICLSFLWKHRPKCCYKRRTERE